MNIGDIFANRINNESLEGDIPVSEASLSFGVKWQLIKYAFRRSLYLTQFLILISIAIWIVDSDMGGLCLAIIILLLGFIPSLIVTTYIIRHSYIIENKIYLRKVSIPTSRRNDGIIKSKYCEIEFNKILENGDVTEHFVNGSKEMYENKENAKYMVFVYGNKAFYMVDAS